MNKPVNHHFVPEHFLIAWATDQTRRTIGRYKRINRTGEIKFKANVGVRSIASTDHLYVVTDGIDSAEFETTIMTEGLDTPAALVIQKLRKEGLASLQRESADKTSLSEQEMLAKYVALEIRNPKTITQMQIPEEEVKQIAQQIAGAFSQSARESVANFVSKLNTGNLSAGLLVTGDDTFKNILLSLEALELRFEEPSLFTSNYPVGRIGRYDGTFLLSIAISPNQALLWANNAFLTLVKAMSHRSQVQVVNFLTLGNADEVFIPQTTKYDFISKNLNWKDGLTHHEQVLRLSEFIRTLE